MKDAIGADGFFCKDLLVALYSRCGKSANRCRQSLKPSKSRIVEILLQNQEHKFLTDQAHGVSWSAETICVDRSRRYHASERSSGNEGE